MIRYYDIIGRGLTASNIQYTLITSNFKDLWKVIIDRRDSDEPETPNTPKALLMMILTEGFAVNLNSCIGVRYVFLLYVIAPDE